MKSLSEHPDYVAQQERYDSIRGQALLDPPKFTKIEINQRAVRMRHLLTLDPSAVYHTVGDSAVIYYRSSVSRPYEPGTCTRIVLAPDGKHRKIDQVGFDPRRPVKEEVVA